MATTYPAAYVSGTIAASAGNQALNLLDMVEAQLTAFLTPGANAPYSTFEDNTGLAGFVTIYDKVIRSIGDADVDPVEGDTRMYGRHRRLGATQVAFSPYLDWALGAGTPATKGRNNPLDGDLTLPSSSNQIDWHMAITEHEWFLAFVQGGTWRTFQFGQPLRTHVQRSNWGRAFSTATVVAGANVQIPLDRDLTDPSSAQGGLVVGAPIWIVPSTVDGDALVTPFLPEVATITAVTAAYVEVATLANNQPSHCLIGEDPIPTYSQDANLTSAAGAASFVQSEVGGSGTGSGTFVPQIDIGAVPASGSLDPSDPAISLWTGASAIFSSTTLGFRGHSSVVRAWAELGQGFGDGFRDDLDPDRLDLTFPDLAFGGGWQPAVRLPAGSVLAGATFDGVFMDVASAMLYDPRFPATPPTISANYFDGIFYEDLEFVVLDVEPPFVANENPTPGAIGVALNANVQLRVDDLISGVDLSTVTIEIDSTSGLGTAYVLAYDGGVGGFQVGYSGTDAPGGNAGFDFAVNPDVNFPPFTLIFVRINAADLAGNAMLAVVYTFTTGNQDFRIVLATPIDSNTVRIYLSDEPRRWSPLAANDVLHRDNWTLTIPNPIDPRNVEPEVESVENVQPADEFLLSVGIIEPTAWSVDVRTSRRLVFGETFRIVGSTNILSKYDDPLLPDPFDRYEFPGIVSPRSIRRTRPAQVSDVPNDFLYSTFDGRFLLDSRSDVDVHSGVDSLKKRIIRRIISAPGGFSHLEDYGVGLRVKEPFNPTELAKLRSTILGQIKRESDVAAASVEVSSRAGVLFVVVRVRVREGGNLEFSIESSGSGLFQVS